MVSSVRCCWHEFVAYLLSVLADHAEHGTARTRGGRVLIPLVAQLTLAGSFLGGTIARLDVIAEMRSPWSMARKGGFWVASEPYSWLLWVLPFTVCYCAVQGVARACVWPRGLLDHRVVRHRDAPHAIRLHYFGSFALIVPLLVLAERSLSKWPDHHKQIMLCTSLLFALRIGHRSDTCSAATTSTRRRPAILLRFARFWAACSGPVLAIQASCSPTTTRDTTSATTRIAP